MHINKLVFIVLHDVEYHGSTIIRVFDNSYDACGYREMLNETKESTFDKLYVTYRIVVHGIS